MSSISLVLPAALPQARGPAHLYFSLSPSVLMLLIFFALPMGMMIGLSFTDPASGLPSLASYQRFFTDGLSLPGIFRTVVMSLGVAVCVTLLGFPSPIIWPGLAGAPAPSSLPWHWRRSLLASFFAPMAG